MKELEPGYNLFDTSKDCLIIVSMNGLEYLYMTNENTYICIRSNEWTIWEAWSIDII